jgi:hypothetical protein
LNCGRQVQERFCTHCGQENTEPAESFGHLVSHFLQDVTHYDSKFFTSLKDLVFRPGFLTREYNAGRRMSYLNPIRMYVFISAVFFLVLFSTKKEDKAPVKKANPQALIADTSRKQIVTIDADGADIHVRITGRKYARISQYDSAQALLPKANRDDAINRYIAHKTIRLQQEHPLDEEIVVTQSIEHDIPKIMFVLLPLFALYVSWFYRRREHCYSQFAIFSLHFHSFIFILFLLDILVTLPLSGIYAFLIVSGVSALIVFAYLVAALRNAYKEFWGLSFLKAIGLTILYEVTLILGLAIAAVLTFIMV